MSLPHNTAAYIYKCFVIPFENESTFIYPHTQRIIYIYKTTKRLSIGKMCVQNDNDSGEYTPYMYTEEEKHENHLAEVSPVIIIFLDPVVNKPK